MTKVRKFDYSPDELLAAIIGMSWAEIGLYWVACSLEMSSGAPIDEADERLLTISADRPSFTRKLIAAVLARGKLKKTGSKLTNKRVQTELKAAVKRIRAARTNGRLGGRPRREVDANSSSSGGEVEPKCASSGIEVEANLRSSGDEADAKCASSQTTSEQNQGDKKAKPFDAANPDEKLSPPSAPSPSPVGKKERSSNDGGKPPAVDSQGSPNVILTPRAVLFGSCREYLQRSGMTEENARSLLGKWAKKYGEGAVIDVLSDAMAQDRQDPKAWITAALKTRNDDQPVRRIHQV